MATITVAGSEFARVVRAVEKSAAKDDARPALAGIHAAANAGTLTLIAADGFRLSTAHAPLIDADALPAVDPAPAILERAGLLAFLKSVKKVDTVQITPNADAWTFAANGTRAAVATIPGAYPDVRALLGSGEEPVLFAINPQYFRDTLASHGSNVVRVSRANDDTHAPLFSTADDGTRHIVMPMVVSSPSAAWKRRDDATPVAEQAPEPVAEPAPVTPDESAFRERRASRTRRDAKRAARIAAPVAPHSPRCATCDTAAHPDDRYCGECGMPLGVSHAELVAADAPAPVSITAKRPAKLSNRERVAQAQSDLATAVAALKDSEAWRQMLATVARFHTYSTNNQALIAWQRPDATYVRGFRAWIDAGRAVRKGEKGIRILAPRPWSRVETDDEGSERAASGISFTVVSVFDVSQTDPIPGHSHPWQPPQRHAATGDVGAARALWNAMVDHAAALGLTVSTRAAHAASSTAYGYFAPSLHRIWVRPERALADMAATLAHELAHAVTHEACADMTRDQREVVAESVAYAVGTRFGLDMTLRSAHYVATWLDDAETFRATMGAIHDGAATLVDALDAALAGELLAVAA